MEGAGRAYTSADSQFFWGNHPGGAEWVDEYRQSAQSPIHNLIVRAVQEMEPSGNVLELGCHCGPLLRRLEAIDGVNLALGVDINAEAVAAAKEDGLVAVVGTIPDALRRLSPVQIVVSCYCLAYIAPEDLTHTLAQCLRMARRGLILAEPSAGPGVIPAVYQAGNYVEWRHEYLNAFAEARQLLDPAPALDMSRTRVQTDSAINALITVRVQWP